MTAQKPPAAATPSRAPSAKAAIAGGMATATLAALALAIAGIKPDEGLWLTAKADPLMGAPTECFGHTGPDVHLGERKTPTECETILTADVRREEAAVIACVPQIANRVQQLAAATRLTHNIGTGAFCRSSTAAAFRTGRWRAGCDAMLAWNKVHQHGQIVVVPGLAARRQRERAECVVGLA